MRKVLFFVLIAFLVSNAIALGVTPARKTIDFKPGLQEEYSFKIINSEDKQNELIVRVLGDLSEYIEFDKRRVNLEKGKKENVVSYTLDLPEELPPGLNGADIVISEVPEEITDDDTVVSTILTLVTQVHVHVPYPGRYVVPVIDIQNTESEDSIVFSISMINKGKKNLENVYANIDIYDVSGDVVDSFNTYDVSIDSGRRAKISHEWSAKEMMGRYKARVTVLYDGESKIVEENFQIGEKDLELHQVSSNNFKLGDIAKMESLVENKWAEKIDKVYTKMQVYNSAGEKISDFKSHETSIEPLTKEVLVSYWDTIGLSEGEYDAVVSVHSSGTKPKETKVKLVLGSDSLEVVGLGYAISERKDGSVLSENMVMIIAVVVVVLILVNVLWFLIFRRLFSQMSKLSKKRK